MTVPVSAEPADFSMKAHDTLPNIRVALTTADGSAVDLTTATTIDFIMKLVDGVVVVNHVAAIIGAATDGVVEYSWLAGDTDDPGRYQGEWEIHWSTGKKQTVPTLSYISISILADLDNE